MIFTLSKAEEELPSTFQSSEFEPQPRYATVRHRPRLSWASEGASRGMVPSCHSSSQQKLAPVWICTLCNFKLQGHTQLFICHAFCQLKLFNGGWTWRDLLVDLQQESWDGRVQNPTISYKASCLTSQNRQSSSQKWTSDFHSYVFPPPSVQKPCNLLGETGWLKCWWQKLNS